MIDQPGSDRYSPIDATAPHLRQRYAAIIAALIEIRPDESSARFDAEIEHALAEHRIDADTARTLRWWQRASVRAAETYAATVVPGVLAVRDEAEAQAKSDAEETAASWRSAVGLASAQQAARPSLSSLSSAAPSDQSDTTDTSEPGRDDDVQHDADVADPVAPIAELAAVSLFSPPKPATRLAAVPDLAAAPAIDPAPSAVQPAAAARKTHNSEQTRRAIRAAFAPAQSEPSQPTVTIEGKDLRSHANPATTA